jgi:hypothetical protein
MSEPIPRFKSRADFTPAEFLAEKRGALPPETDAYRQARREALEDAGLSDEGELEGSGTDDLETSASYLRKINQGDSLS